MSNEHLHCQHGPVLLGNKTRCRKAHCCDAVPRINVWHDIVLACRLACLGGKQYHLLLGMVRPWL